MKHGHSPRSGKSKAYCSWRSMMQRCYREKDKNYQWYGAKGVIVYHLWHDFQNFLADMGEPPEGMTLDRKDNSGNYGPWNCRWATRTEQIRNRSNTVKVEFLGKIRPLAEWAEIVGINFNCLRRRLSLGWSVKDSLTKAQRQP